MYKRQLDSKAQKSLLLQNLDPETLNLALGIPHRETLDYEGLTVVHSKRVSPPTSPDEYLCKLEARQHGLTESVRAFADAVATLSIEAYGKTEAALVGRMALAKFNICVRLPHNIERASLFHVSFKDLDAAVSYVERWNLATSQHVACLHMQRLLL